MFAGGYVSLLSVLHTLAVISSYSIASNIIFELYPCLGDSVPMKFCWRLSDGTW